MKAQQLKNSILQQAMQGKLVPQDPNNEPASIMLERIQEEKEQLIQDKVIKREKPLPPITEEEIPFEIPDSWEWARLGDIGFTQTGTTPKRDHPEFFGGEIPFIKPADITASGINYNNESLTFEGLENGRSIPKSSILMVCIGTIGKCYFTDRVVSCNQQINTLTPHLLDIKFIYHGLSSPYFQNQAWERTSSTTVTILNRTKWENIVIPIAPLNEQQRIVTKIEELFKKIDQYDVLEQQLTSLNTTFPVNMEKSILQHAMQGKLVEQEPNDEPASVLLERIQEEKEQLTKDKVIKREKALPPISDVEIPFEIPDSWEWIRLNQAGYIISGGTPKTSEPSYWDEEGIIWITPGDMGNNKQMFIADSKRKISDLGLEKSSAKLIPKGSIVYSSRAPIGHINIVQASYTTNQGCKSVVPLTYDKYLYYCLKCFTPEIIKRASGTTFREISGTRLSETVIPLPPLEEQKRIVSKIEGLLELTQRLNQSLALSR